MEKNNNILRSCCLIVGILLGTVVHFIYNIFNPQLTQIQVFMDLWWLSVIGFSLCVLALYGWEEPEKKEGRVPKMRYPPPPPEKKASIKDVYEYIETRAQSSETIKDCSETEAFPLYININEVYHVLSLYHRGEFGEFLRNHGLCYDHGFGCDADDFDLPEFPAEKSKNLDA